MCGIVVSFKPGERASALDLSKLWHRGPDAQGECRVFEGSLWLGHTRLAILDPGASGAQPMFDQDTGNIIVFNGEIYNHLEIRERLCVQWHGHSDTETLLAAYRIWGERMLDKLKGMFAFVIYDNAEKKLFAARDRLGIKPLYYSIQGNSIYFASEYRMLCDNNATLESVSEYLRQGAINEDYLPDSRIQTLKPGTSMVVDSTLKPVMRHYWIPGSSKMPSQGNPVHLIRELVDRSVREHLLSDVPISCFLSGGIDSSIIAMIAAIHMERPLQTFSVGFAQYVHDESTIAAEVARKARADHTRIELTDDDIIDWIPEAVRCMDLPSVDAINTYIVAKAVAQRGIKVALSGLGGDELFGGYPTFTEYMHWLRLSRIPRILRLPMAYFGSNGARIASMPSFGDPETLTHWRRSFLTNSDYRKAGLPIVPLKHDTVPDNFDTFSRISWAELNGYMRNLLLRDSDQMSMAVSLELRVPFLDHELVDALIQMPEAEKRRYHLTKGLLVEAFRDILPQSVYNRPKQGFTLPMDHWMRGPLASFCIKGMDALSSNMPSIAKWAHTRYHSWEAGKLHWTRSWTLVVLGHYLSRI